VPDCQFAISLIEVRSVEELTKCMASDQFAIGRRPVDERVGSGESESVASC